MFCGSSSGRNPAYAASAVELGQLIAKQGITLVCGGSSIGLMRSLSDATLAAGGRVVGVFPKALDDLEVAHTGLTELHFVGSMHQRKALMFDLAQAFVALPGGFGTLDELSETLTWAQLGMHRKPIGLLNVNGYFDPLLAFLERTISDCFAAQANRQLLFEATEPRELLREISRRQDIGIAGWGDPVECHPEP